ncbi:hypothetical protein AVEN_127818-1 [Araneus ventricosus]|uniref:Uncharacterized protein n=1 Tax=Araneus ventricosus TaxID=182803 RepID=A0A4Y1ZYG9_ARAVE|nr:hypothetical protein AVEN_127818-1 [Araneus ventricosus]
MLPFPPYSLDIVLLDYSNDHVGLLVKSRPRGQKVRGSKMKIHRVFCLLYVHSGQALCRSFERGSPAQEWSSSSDHGSKLRGPAQNSPRLVSKRGVYVIKLRL